MHLNSLVKLFVSVLLFVGVSAAHADVHPHAQATSAGIPDSHAPIAVMGDHVHAKGEWMLSYRFMNMQMKNNLQGSDSISSEQIISLPNAFAPPANLRVVPVEMNTNMHMLGLMFAPTDTITLMAMVNYLEKDMGHITFMGMSGTAIRGEFTTKAAGFGDTKLSALISWKQANNYRVHFNMGLSVPTGSIDKKNTILPPMGASVNKVLPYAMQLGSGTWDIEPGITYAANKNRWGWGAQYKAIFRIGDNDENYHLGDQHKLNTWSSYRLQDWINGSLRLSYTKLGRISGIDTRVQLPVQTANPNNYGGERLDLAVGVNLLGQRARIKGHRLALEYEQPIKQHVNGVQMEMQNMLTLGYQYAF